MNKFEKEQEDTFQLKMMDLGEIKSLKIRHDNSGLKSGWFLDHVKLSSSSLPEPLAFPCKRWLATDEDDGQIERTLVPIPIGAWKQKARNSISLEQKAAIETYHVKVKTGDKLGAGSDANVYLQLFGEDNDSGIIQLKARVRNRCFALFELANHIYMNDSSILICQFKRCKPTILNPSRSL